MKIEIKSIPHNRHRFITCGDWFYNKQGDLQIRVSKLSDEKREFLVALHELVEAYLCKCRGIDEEATTLFDVQFETDRDLGLHSETEEPGDHKKSPYRKEHFFATSIERLLAAELGVDWQDYDRELEKL